MTAPIAMATNLGARGFCRLTATDLRGLVGADALTRWAAFATSWHALEVDTHMADGGRYRRRRYASFDLVGPTATRRPHQPHFQGRAYNALNGGVDRWFAPVTDDVAAHPLLGALLAQCAETFANAAGVSPATARWLVEMHQFRIAADPDRAGLPTPEGMHRDGVDWVMVCLIDRTNVAGGVTTVADEAGRPLGAFTLEHPLDTVLLDDRRVQHGVTPVVPQERALPAHRDVLVLTYRAVPAPFPER
jgi:hypothetical protein